MVLTKELYWLSKFGVSLIQINLKTWLVGLGKADNPLFSAGNGTAL